MIASCGPKKHCDCTGPCDHSNVTPNPSACASSLRAVVSLSSTKIDIPLPWPCVHCRDLFHRERPSVRKYKGYHLCEGCLQRELKEERKRLR